MNTYLDTNKSVIISSPAGSGKTEKLARRYIALLMNGVDVERILAVTFTEKAAAEMKQRILRILREEDTELFHGLLEKMSLMRVSTIHSFCGTLLRRFSFESGVDPHYAIENDIDSRISWDVILHELLMKVGTGGEGHDLFIQSISENGFRGLAKLKGLITSLFEKKPFSVDAVVPAYTLSAPVAELLEELKAWSGAHESVRDYAELFDGTHHAKILDMKDYFLTKSRTLRKRPPKELKAVADFHDWASGMYTLWKAAHLRKDLSRSKRIRDIFQACLLEYTKKKRARSILDFSDLEYIAYKMLTDHPEWANILYAFDEKTDHILVDEFQDTNSFQWAIIDSLTEEWRSGFGAKREEGIHPTIFLVGDEKQSIYLFRGANVEIFRRARERYAAWLGEEFHYEEVKENYRSLPAIIDFTNALFSRVMNPAEDAPAWVTRYSPCTACRNQQRDRGRVEIILLGDENRSAADARRNEADMIAKRIRSLAGRYDISERGADRKRASRYMDMAILLRKRTHLKQYEEALTAYRIPFVAVKGIGFYQEAEIAILRSVIYFLANPRDDYSLYVVLKSPLFMCSEHTIMRVLGAEGDCLFSKLKGTDSAHTVNIKKAGSALAEWLSKVKDTPLSEIIEHALVSTSAWRYFRDPQKRANIKKFIRLIEDLEAEGRSVLKIRAFLESTFSEGKEPKANVNTEGMDAVKIMTIHAAKGLEFPIVFIPGIEEPFSVQTGESLLYEKKGSLFLKTVSESSLRAQDEDYRMQTEKEREEQKRLFYVAVTRAENALFLTGYWNEKESNFLSFLKDGIGLHRGERTYHISAEMEGISILTGDKLEGLDVPAPETASRPKSPARAAFIPLSYEAEKDWRSVTEALDIRSLHGESWVTLGTAIHRILEEISKGLIREQDIHEKARNLLSAGGVSKGEINEKLSLITDQVATLKQRGIWKNIILPRNDAYTELPFILETGEAIYKGRIDRLIKNNGSFSVYDYKTFPVKEGELDYLLKEYAFQLDIYKRAVSGLFDTMDVKSFIIFTHTGDVRECKAQP